MANRFPTNIILTWSLVFIGIVIYAITWFLLGSVTMIIIEAVTSAFSFAEPWDSVVEILRTVILWHPLFAMFGWLIWGYIDSARKPVKSWEV